MFEDFDDFSFDFSGENKDGKYFCDSILEFNMLTQIMPTEEVGISFNGEIKIDDTISVITDKQVKLENPEVATKTYKKVMEMRNLTEDERVNVSKFRLILKKVFDVYFKGQKYRRNLCIFWALIMCFDIAVENYFGALLMAAFITLYTSPIKFIKEVKKILGSKKRKKELSTELSELHIWGDVNSVDEDEGVRLYFKPKASNM